MDWVVEAISGQVQIADIGTKALTAPRLEELKQMMGMKQRRDDQEEERQEQKDSGSSQHMKEQRRQGFRRQEQRLRGF